MKCLIFIAILTLSSCTNNTQRQQNEDGSSNIRSEDSSAIQGACNIEHDSNYLFSIISRKVVDIAKLDKKAEYVVVLDEKYTEYDLDCIANDIKKTDIDKIKYIFISFYLSNMSLNGPNYAISKKTPSESSTRINFIEPVKDAPNNISPYANSKIVGKWAMSGGAFTIIYKKKSSYYMVDSYSPNNYGEPERLIVFTVNNKMAFKYAEDTGETFVVMEDGLYGYMNENLSCVFSKLP